MLTVPEGSVALGAAFVSTLGCSGIDSFEALGVFGFDWFALFDFALCWIPGESLCAVYSEGRAERVDVRMTEARTFGLERGKTVRLNIMKIDER